MLPLLFPPTALFTLDGPIMSPAPANSPTIFLTCFYPLTVVALITQSYLLFSFLCIVILLFFSSSSLTPINQDLLLT